MTAPLMFTGAIILIMATFSLAGTMVKRIVAVKKNKDKVFNK